MEGKMEITLNIKGNICDAIRKVASLNNRSVEDTLADAIRMYLEGTFDELMADFFTFDPHDETCPILE
jgi:hypothetical protein